ncbi:MAG: hypothetical protein H0T89_30490 [Deltaproteobacteria bacterium]|nr:hypothetical protein [Deltaproteobacteria bacterium]MDQ3296686.1 hypothetical protein [Myxococcota bacterium]
MKKTQKKLALTQKTVRVLTPQETSVVVGGAIRDRPVAQVCTYMNTGCTDAGE